MPDLPSRRDIEAKLREAGLSHRQARRFLNSGWRALVDETSAEAAELRDRLADLELRLSADARKMDSHSSVTE